MALIKCKECGKEVSNSAESCPHCGFKLKKTATQYGCGTVILFFIVAGILVSVWNSITEDSKREEAAKAEAARQARLTPEQKAKEAAARAAQEAEKRRRDEAVNRAAIGARMLKNAMRNPDSFKLESALVIDKTGAVCYEYRAQTGFGGMNVGQAVLGSDGKQFFTNEMRGFSNLWKKECTGKTGQEVATAIRWLAL